MQVTALSGGGLQHLICIPAGHGLPGDEAADDSIRRVAEHLNAADSEASVCIICLELLKRRDAVWSCVGGCSDTVHLSCIQVASQSGVACRRLRHWPGSMN